MPCIPFMLPPPRDDWSIAVLGPDTVIAPGEVVPAKALLDRCLLYTSWSTS